MADEALITGDTADYVKPVGGPSGADVTVDSMAMTGSGTTVLINGKPACVAGDEATAQIPGNAYTTPSFPTPGAGVLSVKKLNDDQKSSTVLVGGKPLLRKGSQFDSQFLVMGPASNPGAGTTDTTVKYEDKGAFTNINSRSTNNSTVLVGE